MIIDLHVHIAKERQDSEWVWAQWPGQSSRGITAEQVIEKMERCTPRIDMALVFGLFSLASDRPETMRAENDYILKVVEKYPDRFIGAGVVDPSWGDKAIEEPVRVVFFHLFFHRLKSLFFLFRGHFNSGFNCPCSCFDIIGVYHYCFI